MKLATEKQAIAAIREAGAAVGYGNDDVVIRLSCQSLAQTLGGSPEAHEPVVAKVYARDVMIWGAV
ncbi:hypothetical protein [Paenirhodobacter populi]|uniref:hypothetical protein n=1 Tax=Paenirhodobacter populi TaxID=2306993 RepID=UPI000FE2D8E5|nr:hypothetical protein [Sinirhodobacter populi]RWR09773.1 hypothetical protein D2T32_05375 [Sinirhodobacter populi]